MIKLTDNVLCGRSEVDLSDPQTAHESDVRVLKRMHVKVFLRAHTHTADLSILEWRCEGWMSLSDRLLQILRDVTHHLVGKTGESDRPPLPVHCRGALQGAEYDV